MISPDKKADVLLLSYQFQVLQYWLGLWFLDLSSVISGFGVSVSKVTNLSELESAVSKELKGLDVVVVSVPSREENAKKLKEITQRVSSAVRIGINLA